MERSKSLDEIKEENKGKRPKHIPEVFYSWICWKIYFLERAATNQEENKIYTEFELINPSKYELEYFTGLISGDANLKKFYSDNKDRPGLFSDVAGSFSCLAYFKADYKTSSVQDSKTANKLGKAFETACVQLQSSPDIRVNVQFWFEDIIRDFLKINTGAEIIYPNLFKGRNHINIDLFNIDLCSILSQLIDLLSKNQESIKRKKYPMTKLNGKSVGTVYVAHLLKKNMDKHSVPRSSHIRLITDLICALVDKDFSEDRLRKCLRQK